MGYVNAQIIVGRLGRDPVLTVENGVPVARFPVGTTLLYRKGGETIRETEWHQVAVYGDKAKTVAKALKKGGEVYVKGPKRTVSFSNSTNVPRIRVEIQAEKITWPQIGADANRLPDNIVIGEPPEGHDESTAEVQTGLRIENLGPGVITPAGGVARSNAPGVNSSGPGNRGGAGQAQSGGIQTMTDPEDEDDFISGFVTAPVDEMAELEDLSARIGTGQDTFWGRQRAGGTNLYPEGELEEFQE